jgi:hypothetical protein
MATACLPWRLYDAAMIQSRRISRFNGQLSTLEASLDRAGAVAAKAFASSRTPPGGSPHDIDVLGLREVAGLRLAVRMMAAVALAAVAARVVIAHAMLLS